MMENDLNTVRELATHAADIAHLQDGMDKLTKDVDDIKKVLTDIQKTLSEARGGWKVLMLIGGAGGAFGAAITHFLHIGGLK